MDFGPTPASFDYPVHPIGIAYDWPSDGHFSLVINRSKLTTLGGKRYYQVSVTVWNSSSSYRGYRAWIY